MNKQQEGSNQEKGQDLARMLAPFDDLRFAVLATSDKGRPYASLIAFAFTPDRQTVIFGTPKATRKYRNIRDQRYVSILIDNRSQTPEDLRRAEAVTLVGTARPLKTEKHIRVFTDKHPQLAGFIDEPGTALVAVTIEQAVYVTQFQAVSTWTKQA
jgi:nitroimidazol reductase NimA-like FMN-containing flavoprotein (pyridoxamine 5'-phosphate oxidase superfamily)